MQDKYVIAKYLRLSLEDGDCPESDSIKNQRSLLNQHIAFAFKGKKYEVMELIDDGYSGTNINRPDFKKLLVLAETHSINCVIVKDFSRFARDYIEVGRYMDIIFPKWQIRFISVNNNYDSNDYAGITGGLDLALQNLSYSMYSQDLSEKIKSVRKIQYKRGEFVSPYAIYGYMKNPGKKHHLIIDAEAAAMVKRIYTASYQGTSNNEIAKKLNSEGILSPSEYKRSNGITKRDWTNMGTKAYWTGKIVSRILSDERYTGKMVSGKTEHAYVGSGKLIKIGKENQVVVENTHEAIISQQLYDAVQKNRVIHKKQQGRKSLFAGLLRCGNCKRVLSYTGKEETKRRYYCNYKEFSGDSECFQGRITQTEIVDVVSEAVRTELTKATDILKLQRNFEANAKAYRSKLQQLQNRINGLRHKKVDGYIRLTKGEISDADFQCLKAGIEDQIAMCENEIQTQNEIHLSIKEKSVLDLFGKYIGVEELTNEILSDIIKCIYVYKDKRIKIVWNLREVV